MTHNAPSVVRHHLTPRQAVAWLDACAERREAYWCGVAKRIGAALAAAGNDAAGTVAVDLTVRESAWLKSLDHKSNRTP